MVQDADGVNQVEGRLDERQLEQVGLNDQNVGKLATKCSRLLDGCAQVHADDAGAMRAEQTCIPATPAARVEHEPPGQASGRYACLHLKCLLVLAGPHHVVPVPLTPEARSIRIGQARKPRNATRGWELPREFRRAIPTDQRPRRIPSRLELATTSGASQERQEDAIHETPYDSPTTDH
jgi:hypothetical protein